ncbi:hypothetical protein ABZ318_36315 [Streptomyces sp. NPDC006197]|uniref:SecDF P1 head subdomain-containing protein n=1 Tax=Streptomyces sp. NPDC006197 TaxID=3156685 RepID=UPI0033B32F7C
MPRTRRLPARGPRPSPAPRSRRTGPLIAVAVAALLAGGGGVYLVSRPGNETPGPVRQDLRLALVEQTEAGECTDKLAPPTFYDEQAKACYRISTRDDDRMSVKRLRQARTVFADERWTITMTFGDEDGRRFTALTERAAQRQTPRNQIAIVLGDRLLSAPSVSAPIPGNEIQISGNFTKNDAEALTRELGG